MNYNKQTKKWAELAHFNPNISKSTWNAIFTAVLTVFVIGHEISIVLADFVNFSILGGVQARWAGPPKSSILPIFTKNDFFGAI